MIKSCEFVRTVFDKSTASLAIQIVRIAVLMLLAIKIFKLEIQSSHESPDTSLAR